MLLLHHSGPPGRPQQRPAVRWAGAPYTGADEFLRRLKESGKPFLVLTNNSIYTPRDLAARLAGMGLAVPEECIWTSALATAKFLAETAPGLFNLLRP
ncbi:ribonucleotide monophosphatase NagD (HAD superfamily) [Kitasatospora sp. MAA4]|nr:ribonucleotide monophosphatase NagD (HAD superfamily) [Kitasatospora sp. MAA4]